MYQGIELITSFTCTNCKLNLGLEKGPCPRCGAYKYKTNKRRVWRFNTWEPNWSVIRWWPYNIWDMMAKYGSDLVLQSMESASL